MVSVLPQVPASAHEFQWHFELCSLQAPGLCNSHQANVASRSHLHISGYCGFKPLLQICHPGLTRGLSPGRLYFPALELGPRFGPLFTTLAELGIAAWKTASMVRIEKAH